MIGRLWQRLTGRPWTTTRSMADELGPPPAVRYPELATYSDHELMTRDLDDILAEIEHDRRVARALQERASKRRRRQEVRR